MKRIEDGKEIKREAEVGTDGGNAAGIMNGGGNEELSLAVDDERAAVVGDVVS